MHRPGIRILKRIVIVVLLIALLLAIPVILVKYLNGEKIKQVVITSLNKHLATEVTFSSMDITLIRSFPNASIMLNNVVMSPPRELYAAPGLVTADRIMLKFNVFNLLSGRYNIRSVSASHATITIYEEANDLNNYNVWKKTKRSTDKTVTFNIEKLTLSSSKIFYINAESNNRLLFDVNSLTLAGAFDDTTYNLKLKSNGLSEQIEFASKELVRPAAYNLEGTIDINTSSQTVKFATSRLEYSGIDISTSGLVKYGFPEILNINLTSLKGQISDLRSIIPDHYSAEINTYNPSGMLALKGNFKGNSFEPTEWAILLNYSIDKGKAQIKKEVKALEGIHVEGNYNYYGKKNSEIVTIREFSGVIKSAKLSGSGQIRNFSNPAVNFQLKINGKIEEFADLIKSSEFSDFRGNLTADIRYNGVYGSNSRIDRLITGQAIFTGAGFRYKSQHISDLNGATEFRENKIFFNGLTCRIGGSDINANGYISNLTNYLFESNQPVFASLNLQSDQIMLDDLLKLVKETESTASSQSIFPPLISFDAVLSVNSLTYKKLTTQYITGNFSLKDNVLRGKDIMIKALDGNITASGVINGRYGNRAQIITTSKFKDVDITKMFYQFNEFGQQSLMSKNVKGKADALVQFSTSLRNDYTINPESVEAIADIVIRNGELNDYEPLQALSRFLDADELSNVRFATLSNRIEIIDKKIYIPKMEIKSSAMDLIGYGTHTFDNQIDYHVNMLLSDVLKAKRKSKTDLTKYVEDDGYGKPRLFLKMTGPIDDPLVQYDTKAVRNKIAGDIEKEKQVFKDVMRKEFGRKDETPVTPDYKGQTQQTPGFEIEWDELK